MNFIRKLKILKKANYLELTPLKLMEEKFNDDGKVDILLPRFKNKFFRNFSRSSKKGEFIVIHLDRQGSLIWLSIDGVKNVGTICLQMNNQYNELFDPPSETETRVTKFLSMLYDQKYISFVQIQDKKNT